MRLLSVLFFLSVIHHPGLRRVQAVFWRRSGRGASVSDVDDATLRRAGMEGTLGMFIDDSSHDEARTLIGKGLKVTERVWDGMHGTVLGGEAPKHANLAEKKSVEVKDEASAEQGNDGSFEGSSSIDSTINGAAYATALFMFLDALERGFPFEQGPLGAEARLFLSPPTAPLTFASISPQDAKKVPVWAAEVTNMVARSASVELFVSLFFPVTDIGRELRSSSERAFTLEVLDPSMIPRIIKSATILGSQRTNLHIFLNVNEATVTIGGVGNLGGALGWMGKSQEWVSRFGEGTNTKQISGYKASRLNILETYFDFPIVNVSKVLKTYVGARNWYFKKLPVNLLQVEKKYLTGKCKLCQHSDTVRGQVELARAVARFLTAVLGNGKGDRNSPLTSSPSPWVWSPATVPSATEESTATIEGTENPTTVPSTTESAAAKEAPQTVKKPMTSRSTAFIKFFKKAKCITAASPLVNTFLLKWAVFIPQPGQTNHVALHLFGRAVGLNTPVEYSCTIRIKALPKSLRFDMARLFKIGTAPDICFVRTGKEGKSLMKFSRERSNRPIARALRFLRSLRRSS